MPELPEVEYAATRLRDAVLGHTIASVTVLHASQRRGLPAAAQKKLVGQCIDAIERRAKIQLIRLASGAVLEVHFRMNGDWDIGRESDEAPRHERIRIVTSEGVRVSLVDGRALSVVKLHAAGKFTPPDVGPEPLDDSFTPELLFDALRKKRGPIKPVLLDQRVLAGIGNIYASEALWESRIHPAAVANTLGKARPGRYYAPQPDDAEHAWKVYDREGEPCARCQSRITRLVQAGRSTFYCRRCQRS